MLGLLEFILITFIPVGLLLLVQRKAKAALVLFAAFAFDCLLRFLPSILSLQFIGEWNWEGATLCFIWPWFIVFGFRLLTPAEVGLTLPKPRQSILCGLLIGLVLGAWNTIAGDLPAKNVVESIFYQAFMPGLNEELVYRGIFFAILVHFLGKESRIWSMVLISILFINVHLITLDKASGHIEWQGTFEDFANVTLSTAALAYLRLKTNSIWPGVICHGLINALPFITVYIGKKGF